MSHETWIVIGVVVAIAAVICLFIAVRLVLRLVAVKRSLGQLGAKGKWVFWGALAYLIFPIDILPDPIYIDDVAVLSGALIFLTRLLKKQESLRDGIPHAQRIVRQVATRHPRRTRT
jgi:uncharacterized membrane protein YkvA (DUF1232 family)